MTQPTPAISYQAQFSSAELAYLLSALRIKALPGFQPAALDDALQTHTRRSLQARRAIADPPPDAPDDVTIVVDEGVAALVGAGAVSQRTLNIDVLQDAQPIQTAWFYLVPDFSVMHDMPDDGVHRFVTMPGSTDWIVRLRDVLSLRLDRDPSQRPAGEPAQMSREAYQQVRDASKTDLQQALQLLDAAGLPDAICQAYLQPQQRQLITLMMWNAEIEQAVATGMMGLRVEAGYWMVLMNEAQVHFVPESDHGLLQRIAMLVNTQIS